MIEGQVMVEMDTEAEISFLIARLREENIPFEVWRR